MRIFTYLILFHQLCFAQDKGLKSYNDGDYLTSRNYYRNILSKRENDKEARFGLGASLFKTDSLKMAGELFRSLINSDDKEFASMAAFNYANILKDNQKNKESLEYFKKAIILNSKNIDAKINYELLKNLMNAQQDESQQDQSDKVKLKSKNLDDKENQNLSKNNRKIQAEAILDALKNEERVNQIRQIKSAKRKTLEKDW